MYLVTKRIEFCYGHRLLDYDGVCKHPHGHNASVEIDVRTDRLDSRNMVVDFSDIKRIVKGWIDRELDHKMILRKDDPLVEPLRALGEPMYLLENNPTVERIARLIYEQGRSLGVDIVTVRSWETPTAVATYSACRSVGMARPSLAEPLATPDAKRRYVRRLFATIADRYDLITRVLSYGQDAAWKRRLVAMSGAAPGVGALDLACGTGDIAFALAARGARVSGLDLTHRMLQL